MLGKVNASSGGGGGSTVVFVQGTVTPPKTNGFTIMHNLGVTPNAIILYPSERISVTEAVMYPAGFGASYFLWDTVNINRVWIVEKPTYYYCVSSSSNGITVSRTQAVFTASNGVWYGYSMNYYICAIS